MSRPEHDVFDTEPDYRLVNSIAYRVFQEAQSVPVDLVTLAHRYGLKIDYRPLDDDTSGMLLVDKKVIVVNSLHHPNRQRFTIAHELGHFVLKHEKLIFLDDTRVFHRDGEAKEGIYKREIEANSFAAELLMPKQEVMQLIGRTSVIDQNALERLAKYFEVSTKAMGYRLVNLGLLNGLD